MKGLIIRDPWIGMILSGRKTWEMRSKSTATRGRIALIRKGSGLVCGTAELVDCLRPLSLGELAATQDRHCIAGDKMIFRTRSPVREFLARFGASEGDEVCIERDGPRSLRVSLKRKAN